MKLKKILSLVVTLVLVLSMITISNVQAAEDELAMLSALGINVDFSDNTTPITRIQLAEIVLAVTGKTPSSDGEPFYPDVPVKHKYFSIVNTVTKEGFMGPLADGSFGVNLNATGMDAGRVLLAELGYAAFGKQANWTDAQYNSKVQQLNLIKGVNSADGLTAREVGKMVLNMLTTKVMEISNITSEGITFKESNLTYIEHRYGYVLKTGEMQANGKASKTGMSPVKTNQAVIDGVIYKTNGLNFTDCVGHYVKYVVTSAFEDGMIIYAEKYRPSEELVIQTEDIVDYVDYKLSYMDENGSLEVVNFSSATRIVINGQNATGYDARWFRPDHGSITFVDTNADEIYDVVNIETKVYFKVGGASSEKISDQWTLDVIETKDYDSVYVYSDGLGSDLSSADLDSYAEIAPGAIKYVTVLGNEIMKPDYANSGTVTVNLVSTTTVSGKITGKKAGALLIDGVSYDFNPYYADLIASNMTKSASIGAQVDAVINSKGQIIDITNILSDYSYKSDSMVYGYMVSMNGIGGLDKGAYIRLIDFYNLEELILKTAENCRINGKEFDYNKVASVDPTTTSSSIYWPNGQFKDQLIKYAINADDEITDIYLYKDYRDQYLMTDYIAFSDTIRNPDYDSLYPGYSSNDFTLDRAGNDMVADNIYLENLFNVKKNHTIQLTIPPDPTDLTLWTVTLDSVSKENKNNTTSLFQAFYNGTTRRNNFEVYDVGEDFSIGVLIKRAAGSSGLTINKYHAEDSRSIIVTEIEDVYDDVNDEVVRQITGYQAIPTGVKKNILLPANNDLSSTTHYKDHYLNTNGVAYPSMRWTDIEVGDIIRIAKNDAGRVGGFAMVVDKDYYTDLDNINYGLLTTSSEHRTYLAYYIGYVTDVYGEIEGALMNIDGPAGGFSGYFKIGRPRPTAGGNQAIGAAMIWDLSAKTGTTATCADLKVGDIAIVHKGYGQVCELFVIRP